MKKATWNNYLAITWDKYLPPIRPYDCELEIIKGYIKNFVSTNNTLPSVLILGSTPELRDIVYEFGIIPTVIDFSKDNYEAMSLLLRTSGSDTFVESNWLALNTKIYYEKFDFILSEAAFNVLDRNSAKELYQICRKLLTPKGKIIVKEWVRYSDNRPELNVLLNNYRKSNNSMGMYSFLCIPLMLNYYDFANEQITLKNFDQEILGLFESGIINKYEYETIRIHEYKNVDLILYIPKILDFMHDMSIAFDLIRIHNINIAYSDYHPIFVYERKRL